MRLLVLLGILPLLLAAAPVDDAAREQLLTQRREKLKEKWEQRFRAADTDASGKLTLEEMQQAKLPGALISRFDDIDTDRDAALSPEELLAAREKELQAQRTPIGKP